MEKGSGESLKLEDIENVDHKVPEASPPIKNMPEVVQPESKPEEASDSDEGIIIDGK